MGLDATKTPQTIGRYEILAKIAEGGMGTVYKGRDRDSGELVAIKIVPTSAARNPTLLKRFEREFNAASALDHVHIVRAIEFDGACATPFLVMEFVDGESLGQKLDREGKLSETEALRIIEQVSKGLYRSHKQGLIHRDIKPDNILLTKDGVAKITDLGLVKDIAEELNLTRTGRGLGTPHFMAPEQFRDAKNADARCDIYSLGATLYMMVTGVMPFNGSSPLDCFMKKLRNELTPPRELVPELSEQVDSAIRRAMSPNPDQRPSSCREFVEDLYGRSTRTPSPTEQTTQDSDLWYLVYRDELNESHTVKGSTDGIRRALREGLLGDASNIVASRQKQGPFLALRNYPEFRALVIAPEPLPAPNLTPTRQQQPLPPSGRWPGPQATPTADLGTPPSSRVPAGSASGRLGPTSGRFNPGAVDARTPPPNGQSAPVLSALQAATASGRLPHLPVETPRTRHYDLLIWVGVAGVAAVTALTLFYFFPH